eukprot:gnl/Dysnectes_brevis/5746_a8460_497.p1 GENE.gnl/Dysnectes_brevis/5746_a8460_497~~gnl/Dysnectes_brevis/5746_a8460_497.p1  ORF type:complete len:137 (+),score=17.57 gnl/Dysnectes_brevis/5746_a8460_497:397-807(+)
MLRDLADAGIPLVSATANITPQAEWLMQFVGLTSCFHHISGYPLHEPSISSKDHIIRRSRSDPGSITSRGYGIMIGDGLPDMEAGRVTGCWRVGVMVEESAPHVLDAVSDLVVGYRDYPLLTEKLIDAFRPVETSE